MRVALVGGAGFIGHNLAKHLAHPYIGHEVLCVDNLTVNNLVHYAAHGNARYIGFIEQRLDILRSCGAELRSVDARNYHELSKVLAGFKADVIIHLAAIAHIDRANKDPMSTFDHSLRTLENSLDVARAIGARLIYFSSSTVYGDFSKPTIDETEELKPVGIYGNLKMASERICVSYNQTYGMPICIVRPQALYGPRCVSGRVTQLFIERAIEGKPLVINGSGREKHDFTYIGDLACGVEKIIEAQLDGLRVYNITGECATSLGKLADIVVKRYPAEIKYGDPDNEKPARGTMSCEKIRQELGYNPQFDIKTGMNNYMDWYDAHGQG